MSATEEPSYLAFARANVREAQSSSPSLVRGLLDRIDRDASALKAAQPRTITTREEVEALGNGAVIVDTCGDVAERRDGVWCSYETASMTDHRMAKYLPATVLREGGAL